MDSSSQPDADKRLTSQRCGMSHARKAFLIVLRKLEVCLSYLQRWGNQHEFADMFLLEKLALCIRNPFKWESLRDKRP